MALMLKQTNFLWLVNHPDTSLEVENFYNLSAQNMLLNSKSQTFIIWVVSHLTLCDVGESRRTWDTTRRTKKALRTVDSRLTVNTTLTRVPWHPSDDASHHTARKLPCTETSYTEAYQSMIGTCWFTMASKDPKAKKKNPLEHLIAGGTAGFVESSICHPLDTIKTRMQLRSQSQTLEAVRARSSLVEPALRLKHSLREPALRLKHSLQEPFLRHTSLAEPGVLSQTTLHEPGLRVAAAATTVRPPPSMVLKNNVVAPLGPFGTAKRIIQREGFMSLYKGLTAVWTGIIPKMAIRFVSFEQYRDVLGGFFGASSYVTFVAGLASGLTEAILVVTPAEVCKIRMQSQFNSLIDPTQKQHRKYTNVAQTAFVIVKEEGVLLIV